MIESQTGRFRLVEVEVEVKEQWGKVLPIASGLSVQAPPVIKKVN